MAALVFAGFGLFFVAGLAGTSAFDAGVDHVAMKRQPAWRIIGSVCMIAALLAFGSCGRARTAQPTEARVPVVESTASPADRLCVPIEPELVGTSAMDSGNSSSECVAAEHRMIPTGTRLFGMFDAAGEWCGGTAYIFADELINEDLLTYQPRDPLGSASGVVCVVDRESGLPDLGWTVTNGFRHGLAQRWAWKSGYIVGEWEYGDEGVAGPFRRWYGPGQLAIQGDCGGGPEKWRYWDRDGREMENNPFPRENPCVYGPGVEMDVGTDHIPLGRLPKQH